jgi:hypothetical protein
VIVRAAAAICAIALLAPGCGKEVPKGGVAAVPTFATSRKVDPTELLPSDLDLVVRVDLSRLRGGLGPSALDALAARLPGESMLRSVLAKADAVTVGLRADDLEAGDRVVIVEGAGIELTPDPSLFTPAPPMVEHVKVWDATTASGDRAAIARVMQIEQRAVVFVTALEVDPTTRVLREGADDERGQPFAEGLVSADWRPSPLRPTLAKKYPSIAGVLKGIARVRATATVDGEALVLRGEITGTSPAAATRAAKFVSLLRDNAGEGDASPLRGLAVEPAGTTVQLVWTIPAEVVLRAVAPAPRGAPSSETSVQPERNSPGSEAPAAD